MLTGIRERVLNHIEARDVRAIMNLMFDRGTPNVAIGFHNESDLWDFKQDVPRMARGVDEGDWAKISADVLAFHNNCGGILFFGIRDSDFEFVGATRRLDTKHFNDKIRRYCGDKFWVSFSREMITSDQRYLGIAIIPAKAYAHQRVLSDGPLIDGKPVFRSGDLCLRIGDETRILRGSEAIEYTAKHGLGVSGGLYVVDEPNYKVIRPDYKNFVRRKAYCEEIDNSLSSQRTFVTSLTGIGGVGKTALSCWMTLRAYEARKFDFIVSVSARDRALTAAGIVATKPTLTSLEDLLEQICVTTGFSEYLKLDLSEREDKIKKNILSQFQGLLFVDNLETVDDPRLIRFLENIPIPTKALVTSRKARIRVANYPIEIGAFDEKEAINFLNETARTTRKDYIAELADTEKQLIVDGCDRIPLIIEWLVGRSKNAQKTLQFASRLSEERTHGEELPEFSFRRIYDEMSAAQHSVLQVLAVSGRPLPIEAIVIGANLTPQKTSDVIDELKDYSTLESVYDTSYNDVVYSVLTVTGSFISREVSKHSGAELEIRKRLSKWYQAEDIRNPADRLLVQQVRRGERNPELAMLEVANHALEQGNLDVAETFFLQARERNPKNWRCHWELGVFYNKKKEIGKALKHFTSAAEFSPKQGPDRARIYKEWALTTMASGHPTASREAADRFMEALRGTPADTVCRLALGECHVNNGNFSGAIEVLKPIEHDSSDLPKAKIAKAFNLLYHSYRALNRIMEAALLKNRAAEVGVTLF